MAGNRGFHFHKDDAGVGTLTYIKAEDRIVEHWYEDSAVTLCFVRGSGKIAIDGSLVEYGGKWFEIPRRVEYQIFPETDTLMLTIQKPTAGLGEAAEPTIRRNRS
ncbi:MAG: hypothetical protein WCF22_10860 [Candidatus Sulfotelmatobacter sp.]